MTQTPSSQKKQPHPRPKARDRARAIYDLLGELWPEACCELNYGSVFQLLVATVLSAQTTDRQVNIVTKDLFQKYPTLDDFLTCPLEQIEEHIHSIGLYRNKAKNLYALAQVLASEFHGAVPSSLEELTSLPGVGRKTANVIRMEGFNIPALPVDTHVLRLANRLGLSQTKDPFVVEQDLTSWLPDTCWNTMHHRLIWHGRRMCSAKQPQCHLCPLTSFCLFLSSQPSWKENGPDQQ